MPVETLVFEKLPTDLGIVSDFVAGVLARVENLSFTDHGFFKVRLSLEEALTNAMLHGNKLDPGLVVEVSLKTDRQKLIMEVKDQGRGFDPESLPDPTAQENRDKPAGRGIFLIKSFMDKVEFEDNGRFIRMIKFFAR